MPAPIAKADLIKALQDLASSLGRTPTKQEMESNGAYSTTPYYRVFGSWTAAVEAADLSPQHYQSVPEAELLEELHTLAEDLGHSPRPHEMISQGEFSPDTYRRRFNSWENALVEADLAPPNSSPPRQFSREALITALEDLTHELGRPPTQSDMQAQGVYSPDIYHDRFGSWNEALKTAGLLLE